ncbi:MAG: hypothetical protein GY927_24655 [bacterium]|nr:hypothetical protein [bacterium]
MNPQNNLNAKQIVVNMGSSTIIVALGDLFAQNGFKAIPVSRHFFETDVAESSLLNQVVNKFQQAYQNKGLQIYQQELLEALRGTDFERAPATMGTTKSQAPNRKQLTELHHILMNRFNLSELQDLCFYLEISYDELSGENKNDKVRELISYLERRDRILELIRAGEQLRPDIRWVQIFQVDEEVPLTERLYPLGTTALVESNSDKFLLFAITWTELRGYIPDDNCNATKMWIALEKFWHETRKSALGQDINIPLVGSGITGINFDPLHILQLNLLALHNAIIEKGKITTGKIRIILYPPAHSGIDLDLVNTFWA